MANNQYVNKVVFGNATLMDISDTTAVEGDVASGKVFYGKDGSRKTGTASGGGGGGASNYVTGTFKGTTTGAAMDVNIPYTGTGYPVAIMIHPTEGVYASDGTFYSTIQRYAIALYVGVKNDPSSAPTYPTGNTVNSNNRSTALRVYKNNATSATSYGAGTSLASSGIGLFQDRDASATSTGAESVKIRSNKKMSVFIASTSYGFMANIEYTYHIIYSS